MARQIITFITVRFSLLAGNKPLDFFSAAGLRLVVLLATILTGCAAPVTLTVRETYYRLRPELPSPRDLIVLDSIRILTLLDDYRLALEQGNGNRLFDLFSVDYSREGKGRDWWIEREEDQFRRFGSLEARVEEIEIRVTYHRLLPWLRQESFDWLASAQALRLFPHSYRLKISMDSSSFVFKLPDEAMAPGRTCTDDEPAVSVAIAAEVDPDVPADQARISFNIFLSGEHASSAGAGSFVYRLRERRVLILRKETTGWKAISQY